MADIVVLDILSPLATYEWTQISGKPVILVGANTATPSFIPLADESEYEFMVTVKIGLITKTARTKVVYAQVSVL